MRRIVLVVPEWVGAPGEDDVLSQPLETLSQLAEVGSLSRLSPNPPTETPEALVLGMAPETVSLRQGPLTVSSLNADPPERSTHFHLSLLELSSGVVRNPSTVPSPEEVRQILELTQKLNTKTLTFVGGEGREHALVWEGLGDMRTVSPTDATDQPIRTVLPEGDGETTLRRYIDDSVNLLSELELNQIRAEEGLDLLNLLWPWGHGVRTRVQNLALRRGAPTLVISSSLRMRGLSRLVGYRNASLQDVRQGINLNFEFIRKAVFSEPSTLVYIDAFERLRPQAAIEEAGWFTHRIDAELLAPILERFAEEPVRLTLAAPSKSGIGLALQVDSRQLRSNSAPFDIRAVVDDRLPLETSWEAIQANLGP
jgi:2,3-bisphosphoglycerate-independent phosphoglycerate mutase